MRRQIFTTLLVLIAMISLGGCASIVNGGKKELAIHSDPSGAKIIITNINTKEVIFEGSTPATVKLHPGTGYFSKELYTVKLQLDGYQTGEVLLKQKISGWFFGNLALPGSAIWMLAVDPFTGGMWNITPDTIKLELEPLDSP